ncbi:S-adenosyl-L-methionine-dependent methyltransferase, partial [Lineolata rhizophorae]
MDTSDLTKSIAAAADATPQNMTDEERMKLLAACNKLSRSLEGPLDATLRITSGPFEAICLRLAVDMKLFDAIVTAAGSATNEQLGNATGTDPLFVRRITRMLAAMGILKEVARNTYAMTPLAGAYSSKSPLSSAIVHLTSHMPAIARLPDYFAERGYVNPTDAYDSPWQFGLQTQKHYFDWLADHPRIQEAFNVTMSAARQISGKEWFDVYPVEERLLPKASSASDVLIVDVGGGIGHQLLGLKRKFPSLTGRLVVEDLPGVVEPASQSLAKSGIEALGHDFLTEQPIKGAKAYYLRTVLHDWPDKQAKVILDHLHAAMDNDSTLLINENMLPEMNVPHFNAVLDLRMMTGLSAQERTEAEFQQLLESAGFEVKKFW